MKEKVIKDNRIAEKEMTDGDRQFIRTQLGRLHQVDHPNVRRVINDIGKRFGIILNRPLDKRE